MNGQPAMPANQVVRFLLLGPFEAYREEDTTSLELGPEQERRLLACLLAAKGKPVDRERLIAVVWDVQRPKDELDALWRLVGRVRRRLGTFGLTEVLIVSGSSYRLDVPPEHVDLHVFRAICEQGLSLIGHDDQRAGRMLQQALSLHRGQPLAGLTGTWVEAYRHTIGEEYHVAEIAVYELAIRVGKSGEVVPRLSNLFHERPSDEQVAWLYMHALYRSGRQSDALDVFHQVRSHLDESIAVESLQALRDLHQRMLKQDPDLMTAEAVAYPGARSSGSGSTPFDDAKPGGQDQEDKQARASDDDPSREHRGERTRIGNVNRFEGSVTVFGDQNFTAH
jgi:DNA-binding SARP family transcriptional activator